MKPALLVADHAPTALLAARGLPLRRALLGTGFFLPPALAPMPAFREWDRVDASPAGHQRSEGAAHLRLQGANLQFSTGPVSMKNAMAQAQVVLCNAGSGTVCTALQAGVPVLMLPMHAEQLLFARRVAAAGAGAYLMEADAGAQLLPTLQRLVAEPVFSQRAAALARTHSFERYGNVAQRVAARCGGLAMGLDGGVLAP